MDIFQAVGSLLTKPNTRSLGMQLMIRYVKQAHIEVLEQKGNLWTSLTLKALNVRESTEQVVLAYEALGGLSCLAVCCYNCLLIDCLVLHH